MALSSVATTALGSPRTELRLSTVPAGSALAVRVELPENEPIDEYELYLSLDDGATFPIPITASTRASQREIVALLPETVAPRARLLLRVGELRRDIPGREDEPAPSKEHDLAMSPAFELRAAPPEPVFVDWRSGEDPRLPANAPSPSSGFLGDPPSFEESPFLADAIDLPLRRSDDRLISHAPTALKRAVGSPVSYRESVSSSARSRAPVVVPLRN